ncbi:uncharacterized protein [Palaemon carinicauda]|uniref:uncharacterized protein n=1 Tax=Palaemon carinicauda TaxID=392227 RepID=UPI0035B6809D
MDEKSTYVWIVFNSPASFGKHTLNQYWVKRPFLLNDLFGVILRFRENPVPICKDISKMYHQLSIQLEDHHVHRFLWRGSEDGPPKTYVKTVLMFRDKPAAAMTQIALHNKAEEVKLVHLKALLTLKQNIYIDDICDTVSPEQEGR